MSPVFLLEVLSYNQKENAHDTYAAHYRRDPWLTGVRHAQGPGVTE